MVSTIGIIQLRILSIKLDQLKTYLSKAKNNFKWNHHYRYRINIVNVLQYLTEYNHLFGRIFFAFILANCPPNAFFMIFLLFGNMPVVAQSYLYSYSVLQMICLFGIHFYFLRFSQRLHQCSPLLLSLMANNQFKIGNFRARIGLDISIAAIHTKALYGRVQHT